MRRLVVVIGMVIAVAMPMAANFAVSGALPEIEGDLAPGTLEIRWVQGLYLIVFAALLLAGGSLGDRFGRKRILLWGLVAFTAGSVASGFCENTDQLIGARAGQALGAALLVPATLSILAAEFTDRGRGAALGLWAAMSAIGALYGPAFGAYVLDTYSWHWIFYCSAAATGLGLLFAAAVKESRDRSLLRRLDIAGIFLGGSALALLAYAIVEGNLLGWRDEYVLGALAAGALLLVIFSLIETRRRHPIVTLWYSGHATFSGANAVAAATYFGLIAVGLFLFAYLRTILQNPSDESVVLLLPFGAVLLVVTPIAGTFSDRLGSRSLMTYGCLLGAGGLALLLQTDVQEAYRNVVLPGLVLAGFGMALVLGPMTTAVTGVVDPGRLGGAAGVNNTTRQLGLLLGTALFGVVVASAFETSLVTKLVDAGVDRSVGQSVAGSDFAQDAAMGGPLEPLRDLLPPGTAPGVLDGALRAAQESFVEGMHSAMQLSIGFLLLAALISVVFVRSHVVSLFRVEADRSEYNRSRDVAANERNAQVSIDPSPTPSAPPDAEPVSAAVGAPEVGPEAVDVPVEEAMEKQVAEDGDAPEDVALEMQIEEEEDFQRNLEAALEENLESSRESDLETAEETLVALVDAPPNGSEVVPGLPGELAAVLFQFPFTAGSGTVLSNITEFLQATMPFHGEAGSRGPLVELPETVSGTRGARTTPDIATLAGYLLLEQRFGRVRSGVRLDLAATALIGAARSRDLWSFSDDGEVGSEDFLKGLVTLVLEGLGTGAGDQQTETSAPETPSGA